MSNPRIAADDAGPYDDLNTNQRKIFALPEYGIDLDATANSPADAAMTIAKAVAISGKRVPPLALLSDLGIERGNLEPAFDYAKDMLHSMLSILRTSTNLEASQSSVAIDMAESWAGVGVELGSAANAGDETARLYFRNLLRDASTLNEWVRAMDPAAAPAWKKRADWPDSPRSGPVLSDNTGKAESKQP